MDGKYSLECATVIINYLSLQQTGSARHSSARLSTANTTSAPNQTRSRAEVTMLRSLTPHVTLWRCAQIRLLQLVWPVLFAVIRAAGAGAVHAHDSYLVPSSPPLALNCVHAHGVVPHPAALRCAAVQSDGPADLPSNEHIRKPRAYNNCRNAGHWLHCSTAHTRTWLEY